MDLRITASSAPSSHQYALDCTRCQQASEADQTKEASHPNHNPFGWPAFMNQDCPSHAEERADTAAEFTPRIAPIPLYG
jgi:hypothetical protein